MPYLRVPNTNSCVRVIGHAFQVHFYLVNCPLHIFQFLSQENQPLGFAQESQQIRKTADLNYLHYIMILPCNCIEVRIDALILPKSCYLQEQSENDHKMEKRQAVPRDLEITRENLSSSSKLD